MLLFLLVLPTLIFVVLARSPALLAALRRAAQSHGVLAPPPQPTGIPIERIAADLRRLDAKLDGLRRAGPVPAKALKVSAAQSAYDDRLLDACRALDVPHDLLTLRGEQRVIERFRVEAVLAGAGLDVHPASRH
jgi:hypothetical protein